jgi:cyclase
MVIFRKRVIPVLLLKDRVLYKTIRFSEPKYVGDPLNVLRIFNDKEVDEIIFLDIAATPGGREPDYHFIEQLATECFMPVCYGGGVRDLDQVREIVRRGVEKVSLNSAVLEDDTLVRRAAQEFGSSTIVVSVDVRRERKGSYSVWSRGGTKRSRWELIPYLRSLEEDGAGEILLNSIDQDGTMSGYDLTLINLAAQAIGIPIIACGGAGSVEDLRTALDAGVSAAAAGSLFVFKGKHRAVLVSYPSSEAIDAMNQPNVRV